MIAHGFPLPQWFTDARDGGPSVLQSATMAMSIAGLTSPLKYGDHRRGRFTAVNGGISFGGGQQVHVSTLEPLATLLNNESL